MFPRGIYVWFFQAVLPLIFTLAPALMMYLLGAGTDLAFRQVANGSATVVASLLCFSTMSDLTAKYERNEVPLQLQWYAWNLFVMGIIGIIGLMTIMSVYTFAEMNNGCLVSTYIKAASELKGDLSKSCAPGYPTVPTIISLSYTSFCLFWIAVIYNKSRPHLS